MADKQLNLLTKVLTQAERAPEGSPERATYMAKAMELSQAYSIDLAVARAHQVSKERLEVPERRSFTVGQATGRYAKDENAHYVDLMLAVCDANDVEVTISYNRRMVHGVGMPSDLDMVERLYALLAPQMIAEADEALRTGANGAVQRVPRTRRVTIPEDERAWGQHDDRVSHYTDVTYFDEQDEDYNAQGERRRWHQTAGEMRWVRANPPPTTRLEPVLDPDTGEQIIDQKWKANTNARAWRMNFYQGFIMRSRMRLHEARKAAFKDAGIDLADDTNDKALAVVDKRKEVRAVFEEENKYVLSTGRTYDGAKVGTVDYTASSAGDGAAQRARLGNEKDLHG